MKTTQILAIIFVMLIAGCTPTGKVVDAEPLKVKIGVSLPLTGPAAPTAHWILNGIDLALERLPENERARIQLVVENDESKPDTGLSIAHKFVEIDGINYVIGPLSSAVTVPTAQYYDDNKVLRMHPGAGVESTITQGKYRFFLLGKVEPWMKTLAEYAYDDEIKTMSILYLDDEYGRDNLKWFEHYFQGDILAKESFLRGDNDFRTQLLKIKKSNPDAVFLISLGPALTNALKQMNELGINKKKLSLINTEDTEIVKAAGSLVEGVIYPTITDQSESEIKEWFAKRYQEKFDAPHEAVAASSFDSFNILWNAIKKCGNDVDCTTTEISSIKAYAGASGIISVDEQGVGMRNPAIKTVKNGSFVYAGS